MKCKSITTEVEDLGLINKAGKININYAYTASIREALPPTKKSELRSFVKLCIIYRQFVDLFACKIGCLHKLLQNYSPKKVSLEKEQLPGLSTINRCYILLACPGIYSFEATVFGWHSRVRIRARLLYSPNYPGRKEPTHNQILISPSHSSLLRKLIWIQNGNVLLLSWSSRLSALTCFMSNMSCMPTILPYDSLWQFKNRQTA